MESKIASKIRVQGEPVAIILTDEKPGGAMQFGEGKWGCVASMHVAASKVKTAVFDRKTFGCPGGGVGLGFGNTFMPDIAEFLSTGNQAREGEFYWKNPQLAQAFVDALPTTDVPARYVVFKPLSDVDPEKETPAVINFYVNADSLSGLFVLANYDSDRNINMIAPMAAGCHSLCLFPLAEAKQERPRAVLGMMDITARPLVGPDTLAFSLPWELFQRMEANVDESFLSHHAWEKVVTRSAG